MNPDETEAERAEIAALWDDAQARIRARMAAIDAAVAAMGDDDLADEDRALAGGEAHKLAGSLGTFGVPEGSRVARDLEQILTEDGADADAARARALAAELRDAVDAGPQPG